MIAKDLPAPPRTFISTKSEFEESLFKHSVRSSTTGGGYNIDQSLPVAGLATHRPAFPVGVNATSVPMDPDDQRMTRAKERSKAERRMRAMNKSGGFSCNSARGSNDNPFGTSSKGHSGLALESGIRTSAEDYAMRATARFSDIPKPRKGFETWRRGCSSPAPPWITPASPRASAMHHMAEEQRRQKQQAAWKGRSAMKRLSSKAKLEAASKEQGHGDDRHHDHQQQRSHQASSERSSFEASHSPSPSDDGVLIRGERRGRESPVPPVIRALNVPFVVSKPGSGPDDKDVIDLRKYPWPTDRPHRADAVDGSVRGCRVSTREAKSCSAFMRPRTTPRLQFPPGYAAHTPRVRINSASVGKTFGDNTEELLCKRVARGKAKGVALGQVLPGLAPVPDAVTAYRKSRLPMGRDDDKEKLRKTFSKNYRDGNETLTRRLQEWQDATGEPLRGTLKTSRSLRDDPNATPFPPKPAFH